MLHNENRILRQELAATPSVIGRFVIAQPASVLFLENMGGDAVDVYITRADNAVGPFSPVYTDDSPVRLQGWGRTLVVLTEVTAYVGLYLGAVHGDGVLATLVGFNPPSDPITAVRQTST